MCSGILTVLGTYGASVNVSWLLLLPTPFQEDKSETPQVSSHRWGSLFWPGPARPLWASGGHPCAADQCDCSALALVGSAGWVWPKQQMWPLDCEALPLSWALRHLGVGIWRRRTLQGTREGGKSNPTHTPERALPLVHPPYWPTFYQGRAEAQKGRGQGHPVQVCVWGGSCRDSESLPAGGQLKAVRVDVDWGTDRICL